MTNKEIYHLAGMINKSCQTRLFDKYDKLCEGCMFELKDNDLNIKCAIARLAYEFSMEPCYWNLKNIARALKEFEDD